MYGCLQTQYLLSIAQSCVILAKALEAPDMYQVWKSLEVSSGPASWCVGVNEWRSG